MFRRTDAGEYTAIPFEPMTWLAHGFGTQHSRPLETGIATLKQIHSDRVLAVDAPHAGFLDEGDAMVTATAGVRLVVRTADCVPILLADPQRKAVAAVHAGWRGTAAGIVAKTIDRMEAEFGTRAEDVVAAIGPSIGECCYEVGREVLGELRAWRPELGESTQQACVNLPHINRVQMLSRGVPMGRIVTAGLCTRCWEGEFFSYRRDRQNPGRMQSWIAIL